MSKSLLFIPDISGYTQFVQTTEIEHSQHVIAELLEVLISANTENLELAEIEGDALFFYLENAIPSQERLLALIESMFTAFYSHLKKFETHRICPCNACATAPNLKLKIIAHSGTLQHLEVLGQRKPFGQEVIQAHRLLKNSIESDNYVLISRALALEIQLLYSYSSKLYRFRKGKDEYDGKSIEYLYALIETDKLSLLEVPPIKSISFEFPPKLIATRSYPISAQALYEQIANFDKRINWVKGVYEFRHNRNEVNRQGTTHQCVIDGKTLDFITVVKPVEASQLVFGELTKSLPFADEVYHFYIFDPIDTHSCSLRIEVYWKADSPFKKMAIALFAKRVLRTNLQKTLNWLED
ncbi:MAG: DUF2652 domain-containing protein [Bacteroidota bacterium]